MKVDKRRRSSTSAKQKKKLQVSEGIVVMELIRAAVILSVMTSVCRGQRSADNGTPSEDVAAGELVSELQVIDGYC